MKESNGRTNQTGNPPTSVFHQPCFVPYRWWALLNLSKNVGCFKPGFALEEFSYPAGKIDHFEKILSAKLCGYFISKHIQSKVMATAPQKALL